MQQKIVFELSNTKTLYIEMFVIYNQTAIANIVTIQKNVWEPSCTEMRPSFLVSQYAVAADCKPEPLFCVIMQVTAYLNGFARRASSLIQVSMIYWHHWFTFSFW